MTACSPCEKKEAFLEVACAILEHDGKVLAAQRSATMRLPLKWEFPGGKLHPGESAAACLVREVEEELGVVIEVLRALPPCEHRYPDFAVRLHPFVCRYDGGALTLHEHCAVRWLAPEELLSLDWAAADIPVIRSYLQQRG